MAYWIFQGNPKLYRVLDAIRDVERLPWSTNQHKDEIFPGDGVLVWMSCPEAGIYAIAEVLKAPTGWEQLPDNGYWIDTSQIKE